MFMSHVAHVIPRQLKQVGHHLPLSNVPRPNAKGQGRKGIIIFVPLESELTRPPTRTDTMEWCTLLGYAPAVHDSFSR